MNHTTLKLSAEGHASQERIASSDLEPSRARQRPQAWMGRVERWLIRQAMRSAGDPPLRVRIQDQELVCPSGASDGPSIVLRDRGVLWKLAVDPWYQFGEAYMQGRLEVEGDLDQALELLYRSASRGGRRSTWLGRLLGAWSAPKPNHLSGSRRNIRHHYDLGNDFYQLWLDPQLVYTCAYFPSPSETLEAAQCAKMELVCRKLGLEPGQRVVEAGCGWGALALYMARKYQVRVRAYNISHEQIAHARQRAQREGLSDRVEFVEEDWRNIRDACDVFVSVGMLEHLGVRHYPILGQVIRKCLRPHGRGLIHSIGQTHPCLLNPWIERRIFPGAYPPTLRQIMDILEPSDLAVLDVENLRLHYAETLRHWRQRFEAASDRIRAGYGASFVRMWRLYLAGSTAAFQTGALHLFQVLFSLDSNNAIPWTRSSLYQSPLA